MNAPQVPLTITFTILAVIFVIAFLYTNLSSVTGSGMFGPVVDSRPLFAQPLIYLAAFAIFAILAILSFVGVIGKSGFADTEAYYDLTAPDGYYSPDYASGGVQPYIGEEMGLVSDTGLTQSISMAPALGDANAIMKNISQPQAVQLETPGLEAAV